MPDRPLSGQQRKFVHHYVTDGKGVPTKAARLAGYSTPEVAGHRLMKLPQVRVAIDAAFAEFAEVGIRDQQARLAALSRRAVAIERALEDRAAEYQRLGVTPPPTVTDPETAQATQNKWLLDHVPPEALSGLFRLDITLTASGTRVVKWQADTSLLKELRHIEKQVAIELGEWTERRDIRGDVSFVKLQELAALAESDEHSTAAPDARWGSRS